MCSLGTSIPRTWHDVLSCTIQVKYYLQPQGSFCCLMWIILLHCTVFSTSPLKASNKKPNRRSNQLSCWIDGSVVGPVVSLVQLRSNKVHIMCIVHSFTKSNCSRWLIKALFLLIFVHFYDLGLQTAMLGQLANPTAEEYASLIWFFSELIFSKSTGLVKSPVHGFSDWISLVLSSMLGGLFHWAQIYSDRLEGHEHKQLNILQVYYYDQKA